MVILITGADGYIGWPTALRIADRTHDRVVLVDNFGRREWVNEIGSTSAVPVRAVDERISAAESRLGLQNLSFVEGDLTDKTFVDQLLTVHQPDTIVHTAAQPSAPYSQINGERANYTQHNNLQATRNLLWGLEENELTDTHFIETTTTGVYGSPEFPIPEGGATMENQGERDDVPFPAMAGSWYHLTKSHDAANMRLAHKQFGIPISDVRTSIVYGTETEETRVDDTHLKTRFDFDYYFGTVTHRFAAQAVAGYPVTVYGKGEQRKPFISLEDAVEGLARLALMNPADREDDYVVYNQMTRPISIVEVANTIADVAKEFDYDVAVEHFENPRDEDETHKMEMENERYLGLIDEQDQSFEEGVRDIFETLSQYEEVISTHEDRFLPGVLEERMEKEGKVAAELD
ncbi:MULTISPECIES: NAD-dependent epimerase/dehydratase family protein [unclassified Haladaptatus]|uniref:NAD-dependent epimerase/dehydratase family protein n=1 Tax=unclassified Haladaptatus TaxID=2622732 RepID=UPI00209C3BC3|nr:MULTISPECIES: NAD-dependent epimerase/dehydratase family protein [unclassified Haladaptatus]MCO8244782.1 NAD-dependent epimerase/dehydratase family protein [Haladaptatus sp. AB643]MCO8255706.1 NAD-dependent epimerase/dehydratase family protein [Haladaptatus sp. AB618]